MPRRSSRIVDSASKAPPEPTPPPSSRSRDSGKKRPRRGASASSATEEVEEPSPMQPATPRAPHAKRFKEDVSLTDGETAFIALLGEGLDGRRLSISDSEFHSKNIALHVSTKKDKGIKPQSITFHDDENRALHHTSLYDPSLGFIGRRGQAIIVSVTFDRAPNADTDRILMQLTTGSRPLESKGTLVRVPASRNCNLSSTRWDLSYDEIEGTEVKFSLMIPSDAIVGKYKLFVETWTKTEEGDTHHFRHKDANELTVLFNPWCFSDSVYTEDDTARKEYLMSETGVIWVGTNKHKRPVPWNYAQFQDQVLECALYLLDRSNLQVQGRNNPVKVCRAIANFVNHNERDGGLLVGRWSESYPKNSTRPCVWAGSLEIVEKFMHKKYMVRYGQCWNYAGLVTTFCRALGIPSRPVTNYVSAHDADASHTIDAHFDSMGDPIFALNDSVWNFHVWTEAWMRRSDLPVGHDGWQAFDATPQETSEGIFLSGPASVKAIKNGEVYLGYDTGFLHTEVNGDRVYWRVLEDGKMSVDYIDPHSVGQQIVTKAVGTDHFQDVTETYKHIIDKQSALDTGKRVSVFGSRREVDKHYNPPSVQDVDFNLEISEPDLLGTILTVTLRVKNTNASESRMVDVKVTSFFSFYTGIPGKPCLDKEANLELQAGEEQSVTLEIVPDMYNFFFESCPDACIKIFAVAKVVETGQAYITEEAQEFARPEMTIELPDKIYSETPFEVTCSFTNPLNLKITGAEFHVESPGAGGFMEIAHKGRITPHANVSQTFSLTAPRQGPHTVIVSFAADQLSGIRGSHHYEVLPGPRPDTPEPVSEPEETPAKPEEVDEKDSAPAEPAPIDPETEASSADVAPPPEEPGEAEPTPDVPDPGSSASAEDPKEEKMEVDEPPTVAAPVAAQPESPPKAAYIQATTQAPIATPPTTAAVLQAS